MVVMDVVFVPLPLLLFVLLELLPPRLVTNPENMMPSYLVIFRELK